MLAIRRAMCHDRGMNATQAQQAVSQIENLAAFARAADIPLRTLFRIKAGTHKPTRGTLLALSMALRRVKPHRKEVNE